MISVCNQGRRGSVKLRNLPTIAQTRGCEHSTSKPTFHQVTQPSGTCFGLPVWHMLLDPLISHFHMSLANLLWRSAFPPAPLLSGVPDWQHKPQDALVSWVPDATARNVCRAYSDPTDKYLQGVITFAQGSLTLVKLWGLTERALFLALKKETNSDNSDNQIKACQHGLVQPLNGSLSQELFL